MNFSWLLPLVLSLVVFGVAYVIPDRGVKGTRVILMLLAAIWVQVIWLTYMVLA